MILQLEYRNGDRRTVALHPLFFVPTPAFEKGKQIILTPESKAMSLAHCYGNNPYKVIISRGGEIYSEKVFAANNPKEYYTAIPEATEATIRKEKDLKRALRKEFKNIPFRIKWKPGQPVPAMA